MLNPALYFVTDSTGKTDEEFLSIIEEACKGGVTLVQLREKECGGREYLRLARAAKQITDRYGIPLIINDRADIALAVDAAGVHVGQSDIPVCDARRLLGPDKIVGATAKTVAQALEAYQNGASYLGVGAMYPTTTKVKTVLTSVTTLKEICAAVPIPVVAIGGLNSSNLSVLEGTGIQGIAVVSAIMKQQDPMQAAKALLKAVTDLLPEKTEGK